MFAALKILKWKTDEPHPSSLFWIPLCAELGCHKNLQVTLDLFRALTAPANQIKFNSGSWNITPLVCLIQDIKLWGLHGRKIAELAVSANRDHLDILVYISWKQAKLMKGAWKCLSTLSSLFWKKKKNSCSFSNFQIRRCMNCSGAKLQTFWLKVFADVQSFLSISESTKHTRALAK